MANYATLKAGISAAIKQNGNNEITGNLLQQQLLAMVNSLGAGYQFIGIATPDTIPGTPDHKAFYLAFKNGTYLNFNAAELKKGYVGIFYYDGQWKFLNSQLSVFDFMSGGINSSDGTENDDPTFAQIRLRSDFISVNGPFNIGVKSDYRFAIFFYDNDKVFESAGGVWEQGTKGYDHIGYIRVSVKRDNDSEILPTDFYNFYYNDDISQNDDFNRLTVNPQYYVGGMSGDTGNESPATNRIRTGFISVNGTVIIENTNTSYLFAYFLYDQNGKFISTTGVWFSTKQIFSHNGTIRVLVKRADELDMSTNEGENIKIDTTVERAIANPLFGKVLSVMGDSISTYQGEIPAGYETWYGPGSPMNVANMWWQRLIDEQGMVKGVINAWSGSRVSDGYSDTRVPMCDESRLANLGNPDVIVLFGGINDWRYLCQLGEYYQGGEFDLTKFRPAYEYVLQQLLSRYPKAKLIACTPCQDGRTTDSATFPQVNSVGYLYEYAESIRHLCKIYGVPCVDLFQDSGITYWNGQADSGNIPTANNTKTLDGLHPNMTGQGDLYNAILKVLK